MMTTDIPTHHQFSIQAAQQEDQSRERSVSGDTRKLKFDVYHKAWKLSQLFRPDRCRSYVEPEQLSP